MLLSKIDFKTWQYTALLALQHNELHTTIAPQITPPLCRPRAIVFLVQGRALGITVGCILGMMPLYFMNKKPKVQSSDVAQPIAA